MAVLKTASKPPKAVNLQVRIEEETKLKLDRYAEFIDSSQAYVVSEALKLLLRKDDEFKMWLEKDNHNGEHPWIPPREILALSPGGHIDLDRTATRRSSCRLTEESYS